MDEYIGKNAAVGILEAMSRSADCECIKKRLEKAAKRVSAIPAVDVAPVVPCKDCRYWQDNNGGYPNEECRWREDETPDADDFCSYGKRKDGDDNAAD